jgi:hypothetical protein
MVLAVARYCLFGQVIDRLSGIDRCQVFTVYRVNTDSTYSPPGLQIVLPDFLASNGVVQGISRVLFPPPAFEKVIAPTNETEANMASLGLSMTDGRVGANPGALLVGVQMHFGGPTVRPLMGSCVQQQHALGLSMDNGEDRAKPRSVQMF